jgi:hypothetical protein
MKRRLLAHLMLSVALAATVFCYALLSGAQVAQFPARRARGESA